MLGPIYIAGPTASGKSALALELAERIQGEIISVDSMQVYRGMDIGTAKPSPEDRARVPHHLIDAVEINEPFDVGRFVLLAEQAETSIRMRKRIPIYCGGTGLYFKALIAGIGSAPPADFDLRAILERTPLAELLDELRSRDPETFQRIDQHNPRRVIRAVEVLRLTGTKYSSQRASWEEKAPRGELLGIERPRLDLHRRINLRVDKMFDDGLVEETRRLLDAGLEKNRTAMQSLGYRQVVEHLRGERSLQETIELIKIKTRQFSKRQMTWFRRQLKLKWMSCEEIKALFLHNHGQSGPG